MTEWIKWNGGECPIKSDKTRYTLKFRTNAEYSCKGSDRWEWRNFMVNADIIAYRITEDHEPMTREQITAQIYALQKQLDAMPVVVGRGHWDGVGITNSRHRTDTHYFDIETINGVPHIHGVAMKELAK